jgi:hypothetical protein
MSVSRKNQRARAAASAPGTAKPGATTSRPAARRNTSSSEAPVVRARATRRGTSPATARDGLELAARTLQDTERELAERRAEIERQLDETAGPLESIGDVFAAEVRTLLGDDLPGPEVVRRAARLAVAEQAWEQRLGALLETRQVTGLLGVSRQRVSTLAREHRLIALSEGGRLRFPAWQFALRDPGERESLAAAHHRLVDDGGLSAWSAASWLNAGHPELDGKAPVEFVRDGGDRALVVLAAERDAARARQ